MHALMLVGQILIYTDHVVRMPLLIVVWLMRQRLLSGAHPYCFG